jgi:hypothetical protein
MKNIIILSLLFISTRNFAGEFYWVTNNGQESRLDCFMESQAHSDSSGISDYWLSCTGDPIVINNPTPQNQNMPKSFVHIGSQTISCPVTTSLFGSNGDDFLLLLNCKNINGLRL